MTLKSQWGKGSSFLVQCPAPPSAVEARPGPSPRSPWSVAPLPLAASKGEAGQNPSRPKVLVAEDNSELASFIAGLLGGIARVRLASNGEEALAAVAEWRPDLLLSDVMMPKVDGLALTRALRSRPESSGLPIVLLTALTGQNDLLRGWDAGADDYLYKPFHPRELQARVKSLLSMVAWRKRSESQRKRQEILEQFTRIASHDLKAPLRRIASYAELLLHDHSAKLGPEGAKYLGVIAKGAGQMHGMIESLIQFSRLDDSEAAFENCDLNELAANAVKILEPQISECGATLALGRLPRLDVIPGQLSALLQNLLENSLKYRHRLRSPEIRLDAEPLGGEWVFRVRDNGVGFDPAQSESIFVMFRRLHAPDEIEGEGMGLAIAKKIVEVHGGRIWADSQPGLGSTIAFTLPAQRLTSMEAA